MMPEAIEKKVVWLKKHTDYSVVFNNGYYVSNETFYVDKRMFYPEEYQWNEDAFTQVINGNIKAWSGSYMIRMKIWLERCPNREIYVSRSGQNMQILLPALYHEKAGYINVPLMRYLIQEESLSHFQEDDNGSKQLEASKGYEDIYINVTKVICDEKEVDIIHKQIRETFIRSRMQLAIGIKSKSLMKENFLLLKKMGRLKKDDKIDYYNMCRPLTAILFRVILKIKRNLK